MRECVALCGKGSQYLNVSIQNHLLLGENLLLVWVNSHLRTDILFCSETHRNRILGLFNCITAIFYSENQLSCTVQLIVLIKWAFFEITYLLKYSTHLWHSIQPRRGVPILVQFLAKTQ